MVCGPSGSGKSTLIRCINHLESIQEGQLHVFDQPSHAKSLKPGKIGMVFQHFHLFPHLTVLENLTLAPIRTLKLSKQEMTFVGTEMANSSGYIFEIWLIVGFSYFLICFGLSLIFRYIEKKSESISN